MTRNLLAALFLAVAASAASLPARAAEPALHDIYQAAAAGRADTVLIISADAMATHQSVVNVLDAARRAGLARLTFAAQTGN